jgi:hypothetical protein
MPRFRVTILHDVCTTHDVVADDESQAIEHALDVGRVTLCGQCSNEIDVADPIRAAVVENLDTGATNTDPDPDPEIAQLRARIAELEALLNACIQPTPLAAVGWNDVLAPARQLGATGKKGLQDERATSGTRDSG